MAERVLIFPDAAPVGQLHAWRGDSALVNVPAQGRVAVPTDALVDLVLNSPVSGLDGLRPDDVHGLWLEKKAATDADLGALANLTGLRELNCSKAHEVTDAGLAHLAGMAHLRNLDLYWTKVTDAGLVHLGGMLELERLHLGMTRVQGPGLAHLGSLQRLQWLSLEGTDIDDSVVLSLLAMKALQRISLWDTRMSHKGLATLRAAFPGNRIFMRDPGRRLAAERSRRALLTILAGRLNVEVPNGESVEDILGRMLPPGSKIVGYRPRSAKAGPLDLDLPDLDEILCWLRAFRVGCDLHIVMPDGLDFWIPWLRRRKPDRRRATRRAARSLSMPSATAVVSRSLRRDERVIFH